MNKKKFNIYTAAIVFCCSFAMTSPLSSIVEKSHHFYHPTDPIKVKEQKAIELINNAVAYYQKHGLEESLKTFTDQNGSFCTSYKHAYSGLSLMTVKGEVLSSCKYPGLIGKNALGWRSPEGKLTDQELLKAVQKNPEGAFTEPMISNLNPHTGKTGTKKGYGRIVDGILFMTFIYENTSPEKPLPALENTEMAQNPKNAHPVHPNIMKD